MTYNYFKGFMAKVRIYIEPKDISDFIEIKGRDLIHKIRNVLRLGKGDFLYAFDGQGSEYQCRIEGVAKKSVLLRKESLSESNLAPGKKIVLGFPLVREEKIDFILQKATELGVGNFIPFICERSLTDKPFKQKGERWRKIITEALRQSQRLWMPDISEILDFKEVLRSNYNTKLAASVKGEKLSSILGGKKEDILVLIGPEGGFSPLEHSQLEENNFKFLKLSSHILRVETASIFSVGLINYTINNHTCEA